MTSDELTIVDGRAVGDWIEPELTGDIGSVTSCVPNRYRAYTRILHPPVRGDGTLATWAEAGSARGGVVHPLVQWHALLSSPGAGGSSDSLWPGSDPNRGNLGLDLLRSLCEILGEQTVEAEHCFFGIWNGWSFERTVSLPKDVTGSNLPTSSPMRSTDDLSAFFLPEEVERSRLKLPGREYVVLAGPLRAAVQVPGRLSPTSPNLIWPADRAWFVASEIDFDSTLIGGSAELIRSIISSSSSSSSSEFEAWSVGPKDSLTYDADRLN